jgi:hypothetical protein
MNGKLLAMTQHVFCSLSPLGRLLCHAAVAGIFALSLLTAAPLPAADKAAPAAGRSASKRCGFYLHAAWKYAYPFSVRTWSRADYDQMFHLLKRLGFDTVMLWPVVEAVPMPLSDTDARAVRGFRSTITDAQRAGLECWLVYCPTVTCRPEIAARPWRERSLYAFRETARLDIPAQAEPWLAHRARLLHILNNADGYVTIDGDPGGYPGAKPVDFLRVFLEDRRTIDRWGTRPSRQKLIPWIWCGWGTKGVWQEPIEPFVQAELELLQKELPEPAEFLIGQCRGPQACYWRNVKAAEQLNLAPRSTMLCYESVEFEPSPPASKIQFEDIRATLRDGRDFVAQSHGLFCNSQTPLLVLPNVYFFARGAADPSYVDKSDEAVLRDFAGFLGGPPELLVPAWGCLRLGLDKLPDDLPKRLRKARLKGSAAKYLPGGAEHYLGALAGQVESRLKLLHAIERPAASNEEAAHGIALGLESLVGWWKINGYVFDGVGTEEFRWHFAETSQVVALQQWCAQNVKDVAVADLAVKQLVARNVLPETVARARVRDLLGR